MINAINRPRTTDCNGFGNSVSCTSYGTILVEFLSDGSTARNLFPLSQM
jgi:hypothetical protein